MKKIFLISLISFFAFTSCKNNTASQNRMANDIDLEKGSKVENALAIIPQVLGSYVGAFGDNKITVLITKATGDSVAGRSIVGGNDRPFVGTITHNKNAIEITAKEPGDDRHDGIFNFIVSIDRPELISGSWKPYKETDQIKGKDFSLNKKAFAYLKDVGVYPEASKRLLKEEDVINMMKPDLEQMRNEIYARHGYCFTRKSTRQQFENFDWYVPNSTDIKKDITEIEKKNIVLIKKFEKYAEDYGDDFGR